MTIEDGGLGKISPDDKRLYEQQYKHGADLFQRALSEYSKSENMYQKDEFKDVMDKAMRVLNETARDLKKQKLIDQSKTIAADYDEYKNNPSTAAQTRLNQDLEKAKKFKL